MFAWIKRQALAFVNYFVELRNAYGLKFMLYLVVSQLIVKGFVFRCILSVALPLFKSLGIDAARLEILAALAMSPWTVKPIVGVVSDKIPLWGYHKRWYIVFACIIGIIGSVIPYFTGWSIPVILTASFALLHVEISVTDLLTEGKYAELMQKHKEENGTNIITFVQGLQSFGMILAIILVGPVTDEHVYLPIFIVITVFSVLPLGPVLLGWLPEVRHSRMQIQYGWRVVVLVCATGLAGPLLALLSTFLSEPQHRLWVLLAGFIVISITCTVAFFVLPREIALVTLYSALIAVSKPSMGSAMDYFYTADATCLPGGPAFSYKYYITYTGIVGSIVALLSVVLYQLLFSKWRYRSALLLTTVISSAGGLVDLVILLRLNLRIGIPDKVFYVAGEAILESVTTMLYWIPSSAILSEVCPEGMEASAFAFMAGISNYGRMVSELSGAAAIRAVGIETVGECNFTPLPYLVLVCHVLLPALVGVPAVLLVPNLEQKKKKEKAYEELEEIELVENE